MSVSRHLPISRITEGLGDLCVARVPLFQGLSHEEQLEVAGVARPTHTPRGANVYAAAASPSQLFIVHTGRVKISRTSAEGHEQIVRVLSPGDFIGESAFLRGVSPDHEATALDDAQLCVFHHADLGRLVEKHPSIALRMLQGVSRRLEETETRLAALISGDVSSRLADYLLSLPTVASVSSSPGTHSEGAAAPHPEVVLPLTKKDIASLLDTTPESLSRQLRRLEEAGVIEAGPHRRIIITDPDALMALTRG